MTEQDVPTPTEMWDFLVGLKETTESGFARMESRFSVIDSRINQLESHMDSRFTAMDAKLLHIERRVIRIDDRLSVIEDLNVRSRLNDHERRIVRLEEGPR